MTRAPRLRSSKRKPAKSSQDLGPENCKENSPALTSGPTQKSIELQLSTDEKENVSPKGLYSKKLLSVINTTNSPIRKSSRRIKSSTKPPDKPVKTLTNKNVLCDATNSPRMKAIKQNQQTIDLVKTVENKIISVFKPNSKNENHVPVYKTIGPFVAETVTETDPSEKTEAVYEFEVDENEEPVPKKKRQRRANIRKPKIGPKALTINNIKYSSTESLASLTDKPIAQRKKATKSAKTKIKPCSSLKSLNNSEQSVCSTKNSTSHISSLIAPNVLKPNSNRRLSVLQETISEQCQSPIHQTVEIDSHNETSNNSQPLVNTSTSSNCIKATPRVSVTNKNLAASVTRSYVSKHHTPNSANVQATPRTSMTNKSVSVSNTSCYISKQCTPNPNDFHRSYLSTGNNTLPHQVSLGSANISTTSARDFLSSTPCKKTSLVVSNNSVFDDSYDLGLPSNLRPSTGYIKDAPATDNDEDNCFGFDEPEELEEPLVSPIKRNIDLHPKKPLMVRRPLDTNEIDRPKPSAREVIEMLKASIPKAPTKEQTDVFDTSAESSKILTSPERATEVGELIVGISFNKPPRRSYERQRRVRYYSDHEEESEDEKSEENEVEEPAKPAKKFYKYKKNNTTKSGRAPKATKAKQKIAKEEEELERLAAQMNAQFQKIEKVSLVVE